MVLENSGAGLFALPKGVAGDGKSLRELFGAVEKTAEFGSAPIFAEGNLPLKISALPKIGPRRGAVVLSAARRLHKGLLAPYQSPGRGNAPAPQYSP